MTVTYEPTEIGESRDTLKIVSPQGGEFLCPLRGVCTEPKPQGPILVKAGAATPVPFKNVFAAQKEFRLLLDNPAFSVAKDKEVAAAKKPVPVSVSFKPTAEMTAAKQPVNAKLTIVCGDLPPWVFYLRGTFA